MLLNIWQDLTNNTTNLIEALSSIGTLLTALIAYRAIKETQRQRESSYRPDLYLETTSAHLISPEFTQPFCSVRFMQETRLAPSDGHKLVHEEGTIFDKERFLPPQRWMVTHFFNIGLGAAKSIEYKWEFDLSHAISVLRSYQKNSSINVETMHPGVAEKHSNMLYLIVEERLNYRQYINRLDIEKIGRMDFIRNNNKPMIHTQITISDSYLQILITYLFYKYRLIEEKSDAFINECFEDLPPLYLAVSYRDIQNKPYRKKIEISFKFYSTTTTSQKRDKLLIVKNFDFGILYTMISEVKS